MIEASDLGTVASTHTDRTPLDTSRRRLSWISMVNGHDKIGNSTAEICPARFPTLKRPLSLNHLGRLSLALLQK